MRSKVATGRFSLTASVAENNVFACSTVLENVSLAEAQLLMLKYNA
jgi:CBS domain-containing protein